MPRSRSYRLPGENGEGDLAVRRVATRGSEHRPYWILYLHGFGSNQAGEKASSFRRWAAAAGAELVSVDFQGHGESGGGMEGLSLDRLLRDVARVRAWRRGFDPRPVALFGSSLGGLAGLWAAALEPGGVLGGSHIAPAVDLWGSIRASLARDGLDRWRREGTTRVEHELGTWRIGWGFARSLERHPTERLARLLRSPARLFQGRLDATVSWRAVADLAARCPSAELVLFDDGDHRLLDRRAEIWDRTLRWFDGLAGSPRGGRISP